MKSWLITFFSVFTINILYAYYIKAIEQNREILAATWSVLINLIASVAVIFYINDYSLLIPSCIGSFFGTIIGVRISKKK